MDPVSRSTWADTSLAVAIVAVAMYAGLMVIAGGLVADELFGRLGFGPTSAGITAGAPYDYVTFVLGVLGAVIIGWMVLLWFVARGPLRRREPWAWNAVATSLLGWFVVDTGLSLAVGEWEHALFNVGFLALIAIPLVAMRVETGAAS